LWPINDPAIVSEVVEYFKLSPQTVVDIQVIDKNKMTKLNFVSPVTIGKLLEQYIDLQFRVTKSLLKKLSKLPSQNQGYFQENSSLKST
jgi:sulfite reductase alpha subunit-like flavoprotein